MRNQKVADRPASSAKKTGASYQGRARWLANSFDSDRRESVHAHGLQFIAPCVRDRGFTRIGKHDRRTVGGVEREKLQSWRDLRRLGKKVRHVLGADLLDIGNMALAKTSQRIR